MKSYYVRNEFFVLNCNIFFSEQNSDIDLACKEHVGDSDSETQSDTEVNEKLRSYSPPSSNPNQSTPSEITYKPKPIKGRFVILIN